MTNVQSRTAHLVNVQELFGEFAVYARIGASVSTLKAPWFLRQLDLVGGVSNDGLEAKQHRLFTRFRCLEQSHP